MSQNIVTLFNLSCGMVGEKVNISSPTEESRPAELCNLYYPLVSKQIQSAARWGCTKEQAVLSRYSEQPAEGMPLSNSPPRRYRYSYNLPENILRPWNLDDYSMFETGTRNSKNLLFTNSEQPVLLYSKYQENPEMFEPQLFTAIVAGLAANIAIPLTSSSSLASNAQEQANALIVEAQVTEANVGFEAYDSIPDWIAQRGYTGSARQNQYVYPVGPLLNVVGNNLQGTY